MARRLATIGALMLLAATFGCAYYGLDVEGKACNPPSHQCPPGYRCVDAETGTGKICKPGSVDGGDGDCTDGETECADVVLRICRSGEWRLEDCPEGEYCFDANQTIDAACTPECQDSTDCEDVVENYYCDTESHHCQERGDCEPPGERKCNMDGDQVLYCDPDSRKDIWVEDCDLDLQYCHRSPSPVQCMDFCDDDTGCEDIDGTSCNLSSRRCVDMTLCQSDSDCPDPDTGGTSVCVGTPEGSPGACVVEPVEECTVSGGDPVLTCYEETIEVSQGPQFCALEGRVVMFFSRAPIPVNQDSQGLVVQLHTLENILKGITSGPHITAQLTAVDDTTSQEWQYNMQDVSINTAYVMDVHCDFEANRDCAFDPLYTFEVYIRADECVGPDFTYSLGAPALYKANYLAYTEVTPQYEKDPAKGLLFGWLKDCQGLKLSSGTGGISMANELIYYLPSSGPPDQSVPSTQAPGFFAAVNVWPIRGVASALVLNVSPQSLRSREVRVFPSAGSLVIFESPKKPIE